MFTCLCRSSGAARFVGKRRGSRVADREDSREDPQARETLGTGEGGTDTNIESEAERAGTRIEDDEAQRLGAVFWVTVAISAAFVLWGVFFTDNFTSTLGTVVGWITEGLGWLYMLITTFFLAFVATLALQTAFFHWCLHPWAMYATIGVAVAYFTYRRGMANLQISTVFRPLIGDRVDGPIGKAIDILAIRATLFGVAVSLGLGTLQIAAGLNKV